MVPFRVQLTQTTMSYASFGLIAGATSSRVTSLIDLFIHSFINAFIQFNTHFLITTILKMLMESLNKFLALMGFAFYQGDRQ